MADARHLSFLGFGYADENLAKLALSEVRRHTIIYGTAYRFRPREKSQAMRRIRGHLRSYDGEALPGIDLARDDRDCMLLLRDQRSLTLARTSPGLHG